MKTETSMLRDQIKVLLTQTESLMTQNDTIKEMVIDQIILVRDTIKELDKSNSLTG